MGWYLPMAIGAGGAKIATGAGKPITSKNPVAESYLKSKEEEKKRKKQEIDASTPVKSTLEDKSIVGKTTKKQIKSVLSKKMGGMV